MRDNGRGVEPKDHEAIFSKFHQIGDTLTDKPQGSGLGLAIARELALAMGGTLTLSEGSTFTLELPA